MERPERSSYTPVDFLTWRESKSLVLAPKFQRRGVWTTQARSFLIDTLLKGFPVPPIYLRITQSEDKKRVVREVVDGQQRISAVLDYLDGKFVLSKAVGGSDMGKEFEELEGEKQDTIRTYSFICETLHGVSDAEVLQIFARLNTYSIPLNAQELRNGRYFGHFKQTAYRLAHEHLEFWRRHRIFSERQIARMLEVELTSELMIVQIDGIQDKKKSIDKFYADYDEMFRDEKAIERRFRTTIDAINEAAGDSLGESEFRRVPLFYSLFCAIHHRMFGLAKVKIASPRRALTPKEHGGVRAALDKLSSVVERASQGEAIPRGYEEFVTACFRQTDNLGPRITRMETIYREAF